MTDTPTASEVSFACDLEASPEKVWRALAEPELRAAWLGEVESQACEVIEVAPPERLVLRWSVDEPPSLVVFDIEARDGGARLTVTHCPAMADVVRLTPRGVQPATGAWKMAA
jgi:uncharacterized protein YndB with AHSA1/START domain